MFPNLIQLKKCLHVHALLQMEYQLVAKNNLRCYKGYHCIKCEQDLLFDIYDTTIEICVLPRLVVFASLTESLKDSDHEFSAKEVVSRF